MQRLKLKKITLYVMVLVIDMCRFRKIVLMLSILFLTGCVKNHVYVDQSGRVQDTIDLNIPLIGGTNLVSRMSIDSNGTTRQHVGLDNVQLPQTTTCYERNCNTIDFSNALPNSIDWFRTK